MTPWQSSTLAGAATLAMVALTSTIAESACPTTCLHHGWVTPGFEQDICTEEGSLSYSYPGTSCSALFDQEIAVGTAYLDLFSFPVTCSMTANWDDVFTVQGISPGTTLPITAELSLRCDFNLGTGRIVLESPPTGTAEWSVGSEQFPADGVHTYTLSRLLSAEAGAPIPLLIRVELSAVSHIPPGGTVPVGLVNASLSLRFSGIPVGASIVSCRGYAQAGVATEASTWSRVKAGYR